MSTIATNSSARSLAPTVHLLLEDEALARGLAEDELAEVRRQAVFPQLRIPAGEHLPLDLFPRRGPLGLLVMEGLLIRQVLLADRHCGELIGPGALMRPWDQFGAGAPLPFEVRWRVLEPLRVAVLDARFSALASRWPVLMENLMHRASERGQTLAFNVAMHCLQHISVRVTVLFWHLADRFGRVTPDGIAIPLPLTHRDLAELLGARRPSVSAALSELARDGTLQRRPDRTWLLQGEPPEQLRDLRNARAADAA